MTQLLQKLPEVSADALELLSTEEMIEVDRLMTDELKIELMQMMENAGRNFCLLYTSPSPRDRTRSRMPSSA